MKRFISFVLIFVLLFSSISFGLELKDTAEYLKNQDLDEWGILALYSKGEDVKGISLERIDSKVTTDYEAYIMGALAQGKDIPKEIEIIKNSQLSNGKFADFIDATGEDLINAHVWGIISLYSAGVEEFDKEKALQWLKENQNEDGGFPVYTGDSDSDLDMTAMGIVAYKALGLNKESEEVKNALRFIDKNISKRENCESLAWNIMSRISVGEKVDKELYDKLMTYKLDDGSFKHIKSMTKGSYIATWHSLLARVDYMNKVSIFDKLHNANKSVKFKDLSESDYGYDEIVTLVNKNVVSGYPDGSFKPNNEVKRSEFAKFLIYGLGMQDEISITTNEFNDLEGHWANKIVALAVKNEYIKGIDNGKFAPEDKITGAQVATMLVRAKGLENEAKEIQGEKWYEGYVEIAEKYNMLYDNFDPNSNATRAQCAVSISKLSK
ncbi:S-layer homology domain-containing protein [Wukongibacter baidiensis]|uniref:S-layer homology domain-containing protein n=1 Tax=Wukongibacter baidiensis TaxID=1723361 RepID=UPI003D7FD28D